MNKLLLAACLFLALGCQGTLAQKPVNNESQQFSLDVLLFLTDFNMKLTAHVNCKIQLRGARTKDQKQKIFKRRGCKKLRKILGADHFD
jgi:hypothetical protein